MDDLTFEGSNEYFVGATVSGQVALQLPPRGPISKRQAIELAAWLITMAGDYDGAQLQRALEVVQR